MLLGNLFAADLEGHASAELKCCTTEFCVRERGPVNSSIAKRNGVQDEPEVERTRRSCRYQQPTTCPKSNSGPFYVVVDSITIEIFGYTGLGPTQTPGNIRRDFSRLRGELISSLSQDPQHRDI